MTSKKKAATKARPKASALSREQKLAVFEEAIDRLPEVSGWSSLARELREFASWWKKHGIPDAVQFHEELTGKDYFWHCTYNHPNGQPAGGITIEHAVAVEKSSLPEFGAKFIDSKEYHLVFPAEAGETRRLLFKCLKDWRRMLLASQKNPTDNPTNEKKRRPFVWCLKHGEKEIKLLAAALNGRPEQVSRVAFAKEFLTSHRGGKVVITTKQANTILDRMDRYELRHREKK